MENNNYNSGGNPLGLLTLIFSIFVLWHLKDVWYLFEKLLEYLQTL